ncbi:Rieske (2Fe-2S) protein [Marinomonas epiphytica]
MFNKHLIPNVKDLPEGGALDLQVEKHHFLITRQEGEIVAYQNTCPHQNKPLVWNSAGAFDEGGDYFKCQHHGALFSPRDGSCITGPCQGRHLSKATVGIHKGDCYLLIA